MFFLRATWWRGVRSSLRIPPVFSSTGPISLTTIAICHHNHHLHLLLVFIITIVFCNIIITTMIIRSITRYIFCTGLTMRIMRSQLYQFSNEDLAEILSSGCLHFNILVPSVIMSISGELKIVLESIFCISHNSDVELA